MSGIRHMNAVVLNDGIVPHMKCEDRAFEGNMVMTGVKKKNNDEPFVNQDLTDKLVLSFVFDITALSDDIEQLKISIYGLARQRGLVKD